jgi:glycosyltransferase involved in cell wall biosynthesis
MKLMMIIPCYNEELVLNETTRQLTEVLDDLQNKNQVDEWEILYIDDGSNDATWSLINTQHKADARVHGIKLAHNVGHQFALWAGYESAVDRADAVISMDADLQHDIHSIGNMLEQYYSGSEVVYGVRNDRATDGWFKKQTALGFYRLMQSMGVDVIKNHADYRLLSNRALKALVSYPERNIFIRGIVRTIGFKESEVRFDVKERLAGESKYTLRKMLNFAIDGITSFSVQPLRLITSLGILIVILSLCSAIYVLVSYVTGHVVAGWSSLLLSIWFIGGVQLLSIGVLGEYIGKIYKETKHRPRYIVEENI